MMTTWRSTLARATAAGMSMFMLCTASTAAQQSDEFVTMTPDQIAQMQESLPAAPLVFVAYAVVWVVLLGYVLVLWRKQVRLEDELRRVRAQLDGGAR